jgi:hyperosmotically inducible protein
MSNKAAGIAILVTALGAGTAHADRPDAWITTKAKLSLATTPGVPASKIRVDTTDGVVTLYGTVDSSADRLKAERELRKIEGVKSVRNQLKVVPHVDESRVPRADREIESIARNTLRADPRLAASSVEVRSVSDGVVTLGGSAATPQEELAAVREVARIEGVRQVASNIKVLDERFENVPKPVMNRADKRYSDAWLNTEVKLRLFGDADVPALDVHVDTNDGVVSLFGTVPSEDAKVAAEAEARSVDGVARVDNELGVVAAPRQRLTKRKDELIEKTVRQAMSGERDMNDVDVQVYDGVVRLTGSVPTHGDKLEAAVVSRKTRGVRAVTNNLEVKAKGD